MSWWANCHTHCRWCDGKGTPAEILSAALSQSVRSLGFSSHAPVPYPNEWCLNKENVSAYLNEVRSLAEQNRELSIYTGMEVDFIPGVQGPGSIKDMHGLDYVIGAVHFIGTEKGCTLTVDGCARELNDCIGGFYEGSTEKMVRDYWNLIRRMVVESPPDIIAHLDLVKKNNAGNRFFSQDDKWYREEALETLAVIAAGDCIVEINTGSMTRWNLSEFYPAPWMVRECLKRGIRLTLNSDSHTPEHVTGSFSKAAAILEELGCRELMVLESGGWKACSFNKNGILGN
ncbi:MAG: histidinol-phosphatase [Candidatus Wallbacteria bacterium]|nr:histidinol-phosphatase [Candidatus Wallbacteria bacterium]